MYKNKLLAWLFKAAFLNLGVMDGEGGGGADFDIAGAVDTIGEDLFGSSEPEGNAEPDAASGDGGAQTDPATQSPDPTKQTPIAPPAGQEQQADPNAPAAKAAPRTWRPEAAAAWATLPPTVQDEVLKREEDMFKGIEGYKAHATVGQTFQQATQPFEPLLKQQGHDPMQLTHQLMSAHATLSLGSPEQKLEAIHTIAQQYGIELAPVDPDAVPYTDPAVTALQTKIKSLESQLSQTAQYQAQQQRAEEERLRSSFKADVDKFADDPANVYFNDVADDMAKLLHSGLAKDLPDAYQQAIYRNPVTRQKEVERQALASAEAARKAAQDKAEKARAATAANVRTTPKQARGTAALGSMDDTLSSTLAEINSRNK